MRVLVACEFSGVVREAFRKRGHDAWSCDLIPALDGSRFHLQTDAADQANAAEWHPDPAPFGSVSPWFDLVIAFPPCTHLAVSGARWFKHKQQEQEDAIDFFMRLANGRTTLSKLAETLFWFAVIAGLAVLT